MSRRADLPSRSTVQRALYELLDETSAEGVRPTVVSLARRLGLANTTFWRHFPDLANQIRENARTPSPASPTSAAALRMAELERRYAEAVRDNRNLRDNLDLAVANIQRLTLDNRQLRQALETQQKITTIGARTER